jgi:hypothetical protein
MATKKNNKRGKKPWRNLFQRQAAADVAKRGDEAGERAAAVRSYDRMIVAPATVMVREVSKKARPTKKEILEAAALGDALARATGMRPLKPPPGEVSAGDTRTSGARVLAREIRRGHYDP